jgi:hypothetical protein
MLGPASETASFEALIMDFGGEPQSTKVKATEKF